MDYQERQLLKKILRTLNEVKVIDRSDYYYQYKTEIIWNLKGGRYDDLKDEVKSIPKIECCDVCKGLYDADSPYNYNGTCADCVD